MPALAPVVVAAPDGAARPASGGCCAQFQPPTARQSHSNADAIERIEEPLANDGRPVLVGIARNEIVHVLVELDYDFVDRENRAVVELDDIDAEAFPAADPH